MFHRLDKVTTKNNLKAKSCQALVFCHLTQVKLDQQTYKIPFVPGRRQTSTLLLMEFVLHVWYKPSLRGRLVKSRLKPPTTIFVQPEVKELMV